MPRRSTHDGNRQPGLALVVRTAAITDDDRGHAARRVRIGPAGEQLWLEWRADRQQYVVAWYDRAARTRRRVATGCGAGDGVDPPRAAHEALAARFAARVRPASPQAPSETGLSTVLTRYLAEHCIHVHAPDRPAYAVLAIEKYIAFERARGGLPGVVSLAALGRPFVENYAAFRRADTIADATIMRELSTLRAAISWAAEDGIIAYKPHVPKLQGSKRLRTRPRQISYSLPQLAAILEAAWASPHRQHVHLFALTMLASHARTEAILECDLDAQYVDGVIDWLGDRELTSKRRATVPVGATLASWLEGRSGKLIRYRVEKPAKNWKDPAVPEFLERPTYAIKKAFEATLLAAGAAHPSLALRKPVLGPDGQQLTRTTTTRRAGLPGWHSDTQLVWEGVGSPNALRHTVHTQLLKLGVPDAQVDAAAGHVQQGTGRNYNHFNARRDFREFLEGVEQLFAELRHYTTVHLRSHCGPNVVDFAAKRAPNAA